MMFFTAVYEKDTTFFIKSIGSYFILSIKMTISLIPSTPIWNCTDIFPRTCMYFSRKLIHITSILTKMELLNELTQPHVEQNARSVPVVLDGKFFVIVSTEPNGTVKAKCLNCANGKKSKNAIVSGRFQPSSNFTTHLKVHSNLLIPSIFI